MLSPRVTRAWSNALRVILRVPKDVILREEANEKRKREREKKRERKRD
jgi:hypothetical protein